MPPRVPGVLDEVQYALLIVSEAGVKPVRNLNPLLGLGWNSVECGSSPGGRSDMVRLHDGEMTVSPETAKAEKEPTESEND